MVQNMAQTLFQGMRTFVSVIALCYSIACLLSYSTACLSFTFLCFFDFSFYLHMAVYLLVCVVLASVFVRFSMCQISWIVCLMWTGM